jgi:hypothetical protein
MIGTGIAKAFEDSFKEHNIPVHHTNRSYVLECPKCGKNKKYYVEKSTGFGVCFSCGTKTGPAYSYSLVFNIPYAEAKDILHWGEYTARDKIDDLFPREVPEEPEPDVVVKFGYGFTLLDGEDPGSLYGMNRGAELDDMQSLGCRYNAYQQRLVFPVYNMFRELVGWQGRDITGTSTLKALSTEFKKGNHLMGSQLILPNQPLAIVEGPFDMLHLMAAGVPAVCAFGKNISARQIELLKYLQPKKILICLDSDAALEAEALAFVLGRSAKICLPAPYKDYGEMPIDEIRSKVGEGYYYHPLRTISNNLFK